jgi:hypothetical protein
MSRFHRVHTVDGEEQDFPTVAFDKSGWVTCELEEPTDEGVEIVTLPPHRVEAVETLRTPDIEP